MHAAGEAASPAGAVAPVGSSGWSHGYRRQAHPDQGALSFGDVGRSPGLPGQAAGATMTAGGGDTPRLVSLGRLLLDRLRTGRTSPVSTHRSDQLPPTPSAAELTDAFGAVETGSVVAVERLSFALLAIDRSDVADLQRRALVELNDLRVDAWLALDLCARRSWWYAPRWSDELRRQLSEAAPGSLSLIIGSFHPDGYIREACVAILSESSDVLATRPLALRTADWVEQVRDRARIAIERRLSDGGSAQLLAAAPIGLAMSARRDGTWLASAITTRIRTGSHDERAALLDVRDRRTRRLAYAAAIDHG